MAKGDERTLTNRGVSRAVEDYLKAIYTLSQDQAQVSTSLISEQLSVRPASVTGMLKTMSEMELVSYTPYRGVELTARGVQIALEVIRHHRLLELYLVEALGYSWDEVHEEAEALEHHISEKFEARIAAALGHPTFDPHGDPIPTVSGEIPVGSTRRLGDIGVSEGGVVERVVDQNPERLRYLSGMGIIPGAHIVLVESAPFDGPVTVCVGEANYALDRRLARKIILTHAEKE